MIINRLTTLLAVFFTLIFVFSSCGKTLETDNSNNSNNSNDSNDLIDDIDTNVVSNNQTNNGIDSNDNSPTDSNNNDLQPDIEKEIIDAYGNFTKLHKTIVANDRMKQMNYSKSVYNIGSKYTPDELRTTRLQATIISSAKVFFPNASDFMGHYLEGSGEIYELDVEDFLEDKTAKENMYKDVNAALRATEIMYSDGEKNIIYQVEESLHHNLTGDWKYSVGSYFTSVEIYNIKESTILGCTYYTAKIKYVVQDFYNWDSNDNNDISITSVSPADLHQLHVNGEAQEFLTYGEIEFEIKWVKGIDASTIKFEEVDD